MVVWGMNVPLWLAKGPCLLGHCLYPASTNDEGSLSAFLPWLDVLQLLPRSIEWRGGLSRCLSTPTPLWTLFILLSFSYMWWSLVHLLEVSCRLNTSEEWVLKESLIPWPFCCSVNSLAGCRVIPIPFLLSFSLCLRVFKLWVLLKNKLSNSYLCETLVVLKLDCSSCAIRWIMKNEIGEDQAQGKEHDSFPWSVIWTMATWKVVRDAKPRVLRLVLGAALSPLRLKQEVTGQMGRACRLLLGLSYSRVLVKESISL